MNWSRQRLREAEGFERRDAGGLVEEADDDVFAEKGGLDLHAEIEDLAGGGLFLKRPP